jgi:hypothetical protein
LRPFEGSFMVELLRGKDLKNLLSTGSSWGGLNDDRTRLFKAVNIMREESQRNEGFWSNWVLVVSEAIPKKENKRIRGQRWSGRRNWSLRKNGRMENQKSIKSPAVKIMVNRFYRETTRYTHI